MGMCFGAQVSSHAWTLISKASLQSVKALKFVRLERRANHPNFWKGLSKLGIREDWMCTLMVT